MDRCYKYYRAPHLDSSPYRNLIKIIIRREPRQISLQYVDTFRYFRHRFDSTESLRKFIQLGFLDGVRLYDTSGLDWVFTLALLYNRLNLVREFKQEFNFNPDRVYCPYPTGFDPYTIRYLLNSGIDVGDPSLIRHTLVSGNLSSVMYLRKRGSSLFCSDGLEIVSRTGNLKLVKFLVNCEIPITRGCIRAVLLRDYYPIFEYFLDRLSNLDDIVDQVIEHRDLKGIRLIMNRKVIWDLSYIKLIWASIWIRIYRWF